jgi:phytoene synthase
VSRRAVVPGSRKLGVLLRSSTALIARPDFARAPLSPHTAFLIEAVAVAQPVAPPRKPMPWHRIRNRAIWVIDLFERLERAQMERVG